MRRNVASPRSLAERFELVVRDFLRSVQRSHPYYFLGWVERRERTRRILLHKEFPCCESTMMDLALLHASCQSVLRFDLPLIVLTVMALCPLLCCASLAVVVDKPLDVEGQNDNEANANTLRKANHLLESDEVVLLDHDETNEYDYREHFSSNRRHVGVKGSERINVKAERLPPVHHEHAQPLSAKTSPKAVARHRRRTRVTRTK